MKKILGLDLGAASIGWAMISENDSDKVQKTEIIGMGSRIIPYEGTEGSDFTKGKGESRNAIRTKARTIRRGYDRYQMRRSYLVDILKKNNMLPGEELIGLPKIELWRLRSKSADSRIEAEEVGRVLLLLNQKRGYKSSRSDANLDKKDTEYVAIVKNRYDRLKEKGLTIGQYFYEELKNDQFFRVKEKVFPREAYLEEFDRIIKVQRQFYPALNDAFINKLRNEIIFYQRPLKSQKGLVSVCDFEGFWTKKDDKEFFVGPKVAPVSSPLFQIERLWENINNIKIYCVTGEPVEISIEQKRLIFDHLNYSEKITAPELLKILRLKKDSCIINKQLEKGLKGNVTNYLIGRCFYKTDILKTTFPMDLKIVDNIGKVCHKYDRKTGEVLISKSVKYIDTVVEKEPLYRLWHTIYSIQDEEECKKALISNFKIVESVADKLVKIDFQRYGFGNKSVKVIRKILPYLMEGDSYSDSMSYAGYDHSQSLSKNEKSARKTEDKLKLLKKNSLRQPVVEKILNQMINLVNALIVEHGKPDEIRVELARELKQSKEERNDTELAMSKIERENENIKKHLEEYGLRATRNNILKWRLYHEINDDDKKLNAICIYCGQPISIMEALNGTDVDIEHIIPKSRLFDDSQSNKTLAHRHCNSDKNDRTAFDFMKSKPSQIFDDYVDRVNNLYSNKIIGKGKRDKLLMTESKIPDNFIDRQLRESQYISKKAIELLQQVSNNVVPTSGKVTAELRHLWGWDDVTMNLQFPKYKELGLTEIKEWESDHGKNIHSKEVITDWSKRDDHRHHAVDALTIACTKQGFIQRFNTLNASKTRDELYAETKNYSVGLKKRLSLLEKYIISNQPISVSEVEAEVSKILVSFKAGKKVAVTGSRKTGKRGNKKVVQNGIIIPRGALSEESVYGKIRTLETQKVKYLFENSHLIFKPYIRKLVEERIENNKGDHKIALNSLKKDPIYIDKENKTKLEYASCYKNEYVIKYPVDVNFGKIDKVVDKNIKEILLARLDKFEGKPKEAFKDVIREDKSIVKWYEDEGLKNPIKSVRCFTGLSAVVPVRKDKYGNEVGYVKPGNNHHIAIYSDSDGNMIEHVCTFWHAVERKKNKIPVIIQSSNDLWDMIIQSPEGRFDDSFQELLPKPNLHLVLSMQQNEMFILGMHTTEIISAINQKDYNILSNNLYRVQKLGSSYYTFRHHLETKIVEDNDALKSKRFQRIRSLKALFEINPYKIKIDKLGKVSSITNLDTNS
jgi:CRISPR-associated endonuclease Csn1